MTHLQLFTSNPHLVSSDRFLVLTKSIVLYLGKKAKNPFQISFRGTLFRGNILKILSLAPRLRKSELELQYRIPLRITSSIDYDVHNESEKDKQDMYPNLLSFNNDSNTQRRYYFFDLFCNLFRQPLLNLKAPRCGNAHLIRTQHLCNCGGANGHKAYCWQQ